VVLVVLFFLFFGNLGFELRVSCLLDRWSTTWATPPAPWSFRCCFYFFVVLEFELRASLLPGRWSTTWATPPSLFTLVISQIGFYAVVWLVLDWVWSAYLCLLSSWDYRSRLPHLALTFFFVFTFICTLYTGLYTSCHGSGLDFCTGPVYWSCTTQIVLWLS
jgi:hypothetical protein